MTKYAYYDQNSPPPQRVMGWYDSERITHLPPKENLIQLTEEQWDARIDNTNGFMVENGAIVSYIHPPPLPITVITFGELLQRFTPEQRSAMTAATRTNDQVLHWFLMGAASNTVDLTSADLASSLDMLVSLKIITPEDKAAILTP